MSEKTIEVLESSEIAERLGRLSARFDEFRGRL